MTDKIKSAIADFQEWIDRAEEFNQNVQSDHVKAMKLAIRSLQAWEEVLQELEELKNEPYTMHIEEDWQDGVISAINIIKQKLAEIEEVR